MQKIILVSSIEKLKEQYSNNELINFIKPIQYINPLITIPLFQAANYTYKKIREKGLSEKTESQILKGLEKYLDIGYPISRYNPEEAAKRFKFSAGIIPKDGTFYVQHPVYDDIYLLPEEINKVIYSEKEAAFFRLASTLGARTITLKSIQVDEKKGLFGGSVSAKEVAAEMGVSMSFENDNSFKKEVFKSFNKPKFEKPFIPDDIAKWVQTCPELRTMASDRLQANIAEAQVKLVFARSLGLESQVIGKLASKGMKFGGNYKSLHQSIWSFEINYYDM